MKASSYSHSFSNKIQSKKYSKTKEQNKVIPLKVYNAMSNKNAFQQIYPSKFGVRKEKKSSNKSMLDESKQIIENPKIRLFEKKYEITLNRETVIPFNSHEGKRKGYERQQFINSIGFSRILSNSLELKHQEIKSLSKSKIQSLHNHALSKQNPFNIAATLQLSHSQRSGKKQSQQKYQQSHPKTFEFSQKKLQINIPKTVTEPSKKEKSSTKLKNAKEHQETVENIAKDIAKTKKSQLTSRSYNYSTIYKAKAANGALKAYKK